MKAAAALPMLMILLLGAGCATGGKSTASAPAETGPPSSGPGAPGTDDDTQAHACSAPASSPRGSCGGCSVSCGEKQASCRAGEEWPSGGPSCQQPAVCTCH